MSVSNKTLAVMLLAAIVVSLGGTFISLNRLGAMTTPTGYQITDTGTVTFEINQTLQITTIDRNTIDFGTCELGDNSAGITVNSDNTENTSRCDGTVAGGIAVRNNGNLDAVVTMYVDKVGTINTGTFLDTGSTDSDLLYRFEDGGVGYGAGCAGTLGAATYTSLTTAGSGAGEVSACTNLTAHGTDNSILSHFEIVIPTAASAGDSVTVTYVAAEA
ncbi:MAG: hypothetical protein ACLFN8_02495 [Candidatus Woesearchaeota archaeon]